MNLKQLLFCKKYHLTNKQTSTTLWVIGVFFVFIQSSFTNTYAFDWGFYCHRMIAERSIALLPSEIIPFFKQNAQWIIQHSIDPDSRKFTQKSEGIKHYIDLDYKNKLSLKSLKNPWKIVHATAVELYYIKNEIDTVPYLYLDSIPHFYDSIFLSDGSKMKFGDYFQFFHSNISELADGSQQWGILSEQSMQQAPFSYRGKLLWKDPISKHGIVPYSINDAFLRLVDGFKTRDKNKILRRLTDLSHYIADAHVPLHTTKNYNGQFTDQIGIHAFWESRLPELFIDNQVDLPLNKAQFHINLDSLIWSIIEKSHAKLGETLQSEAISKVQLSEKDLYAFEQNEKGNLSKESSVHWSKLYFELVENTIKERLTSAIQVNADLWYSAWIMAGKPNIEEIH